MEIGDGWFEAGHVVDMIDGFLLIWALVQQHAEFAVDLVSGGDDEHGVEALPSVLAVEEHCLGVLIGDCVDERDSLEFCMWAFITA